MTRRWTVVAPLVAGALLALGGCSGPSPSERYELYRYRSWLQDQPGVESVDTDLVPASCDMCWFGPPYTGSVTIHMRPGTSPDRLVALGQAVRAHRGTVGISTGTTAVPVVVDGLTVTLGGLSDANELDVTAIERDDVALLDAVRRMNLPGVKGKVDGGVVALTTTRARMLDDATALAAAGSPLTTAAAATRAASTAGNGRPAIPPGTVFLDVVAADDDNDRLSLLIGSGALATRSRAGLATLHALGGAFPRARFAADTQDDIVALDDRGQVTAQQWDAAVTTVAAHLPRGTVRATVRRADPDPLVLSVPLGVVPPRTATTLPALADAVPADILVTEIGSDGPTMHARVQTRGPAFPTRAEEQRILAEARTWPLGRVVARYSLVLGPHQTNPAHPPTVTSPP